MKLIVCIGVEVVEIHYLMASWSYTRMLRWVEKVP